MEYCAGRLRAEILSLLDSYKAMGCKRIVALRGDLPSGMASYGDFRYASELVAFIRAERDGYFHIEVACYPEMHPQAGDAHSDLKNFISKVNAGANGAITQYFYNPDAYFRFVDDARKHGVEVPIVPGIMPITQYSQLRRFSDMCGAEIPRWIAKRLESFRDDADAIREFGADVVTDLCRRLIDGGAPSIHFYTLNRAKATLAVCERLGPQQKASLPRSLPKRSVTQSFTCASITRCTRSRAPRLVIACGRSKFRYQHSPSARTSVSPPSTNSTLASVYTGT